MAGEPASQWQFAEMSPGRDLEPSPVGSDVALLPAVVVGPTGGSPGGGANVMGGEASVSSARSAESETMSVSSDIARDVAASWPRPPVGLPEEVGRIFRKPVEKEELELQAPLIKHRGGASSSAAGGGLHLPHDDAGFRQSSLSTGARGSDAEMFSINEETVKFDHNGYTLVFLSGRVDFLMVMVFIASGQFGVLWLVAMSSPEYFFESGQWIVPISAYGMVNFMKAFSLLLTLFRVTGEFRDATKMYRAVYHKLKTPISHQQRILGVCAFLLQYIFATLVLFMAIHLILASTTPIGTIGKLWVVYIVLDFDNHWCNFMLYILHLQDAYDWKVIIDNSKAANQPKESLVCYFAPVCIGLAIVAYSLVRNICPLTALHYGIVRNDDPVLMLSSNLGLPQGCCPPQIDWGNQTTRSELLMPANVSVPVVSPSLEPPWVYYVILEDGRPVPSSLQVMEGRGGDGNWGLRYGRIDTVPLQMHYWLSLHGFPRSEVFEALQGEGQGGLGLYANNYPFLAKWEIREFAWRTRVRIWAAAQNPVTGALSPTPVQSAVILQKLCPSRCLKCNAHSGACFRCDEGYVLVRNECRPCAPGCTTCEHAGPGLCDDGGCNEGSGLVAGGVACLPCTGASLCMSCDAAASATPTLRPQGPSGQKALPCHKCKTGHGLDKNATCRKCEMDNCGTCPDLAECKECIPGFVLTEEETMGDDNETKVSWQCLPCAAHCSGCSKLGAGKCDPEQCEAGYSLSPTGVCKACSPHCTKCAKSGPGNCDAGFCKTGYGLQGYDACAKCQSDHCNVCETSPSSCDACSEGYGLTPERNCEACADSCKRCTEIGDCAECAPRFGLHGGKCFACADQCEQCSHAGPGNCDAGKCFYGWRSRSLPDGSTVCVRNATAELQR